MLTPYGWSVNVPWESNPATLWRTQQALELLQPDRWMDYYCAQPVEFPGYVPTVRSFHLDGPLPPEVTERLVANPVGETWLLLNEPHSRSQDDCTPARGRDLALRFIQLARSLDVDINWCGPNCAANMPAQPTELFSGAAWWREWLKLLRRAGLLAPSYHGIHMYHSRTRSAVEDFWSHLVGTWRWQWMGSGPVIVTEACGENLPLAGQVEVMDALWRLYDTGRREGPTSKNGVMGVFWFAAYDYGLWPNCALAEVDPDKDQTMRLTPLGRHWVELKNRS